MVLKNCNISGLKLPLIWQFELILPFTSVKWHRSVNEGFMWSLLQIFFFKLLCFSLMKRPKQDRNGYPGSYAGCSYFCCENYRTEEIWGFCNRVEAQDITEPFQQLALQCKCKNLGLSCKYKYYAIAIFYDSEHDPCHWMNNLSGWKRTWKKLMFDRESNPDLCNDWKLILSVH